MDSVSHRKLDAMLRAEENATSGSKQLRFSGETPEDLVKEAIQIRKDIQGQARRLQEIYSSLYVSVRRSPSSDMTSAYVTFANAGKRFAGVLLQVTDRTASFDKILVTAKEEMEEKERRRAQERADRVRREAKKEAARKLAETQSTFLHPEDISDLFGSEEEPTKVQIKALEIEGDEEF